MQPINSTYMFILSMHFRCKACMRQVAGLGCAGLEGTWQTCNQVGKKHSNLSSSSSSSLSSQQQQQQQQQQQP
jgi:hypothetical protein